MTLADIGNYMYNNADEFILFLAVILLILFYTWYRQYEREMKNNSFLEHFLQDQHDDHQSK